MKQPEAYALGKVDFLGCSIATTRAALIPRPETEIMVDMALNLMKDGTRRVFDVCCGTGCIGLGVKKQRPNMQVYLSDLSKEALDLSKQNAKKNQLDVSFFEGDLLTPFEGLQADYVFCNPPYISKSDYDKLDPLVRDFEPKMALIGGEDGYAFYHRLSKELPSYVNEGGKVFIEIGTGMGKEVVKIFSHGPWESLEVFPDWAGHDRFFFLSKQN